MFPEGSWIHSARNYYIDNNILIAELLDTNNNWCKNKIVLDANKFYDNYNGSFYAHYKSNSTIILPEGSWIDSARNYYINNNILIAELLDTNNNWCKNEIVLDANKNYDNINGSFQGYNKDYSLVSNNKMKFAFLIMYEIRCLKKIENLYKYIINHYNADIIICCQELDDTHEKLKLFDKNVIFKKVYSKKNPQEYYNNSKLGSYAQQNWNNNACLQIYINWNEMADVLEDYKDKYDYFILTRTDLDILFPFPEIDFFSKIPKAIYSFDANYDRSWGGSACGVFIHNDYIINYLRCTANILRNDSLINKFITSYNLLNQENFKNFCVKENNITYKYIKNTNYFFITDNINSYTTWGIPQKNDKYDGFIKMPEQFEEAYDNLILWDNGYRWHFKNDSIILSL